MGALAAHPGCSVRADHSRYARASPESRELHACRRSRAQRGLLARALAAAAGLGRLLGYAQNAGSLSMRQISSLVRHAPSGYPPVQSQNEHGGTNEATALGVADRRLGDRRGLCTVGAPPASMTQVSPSCRQGRLSNKSKCPKTRCGTRR